MCRVFVVDIGVGRGVGLCCFLVLLLLVRMGLGVFRGLVLRSSLLFGGFVRGLCVVLG